MPLDQKKNKISQLLSNEFKQKSVFDSDGALTAQAQSNLEKNTRIVELNGQDRQVIRPGALYPGLWGWDTPFHSMGLAHYDAELALEQLSVSGLGQTKEGMIPHILFYDTQLAEDTYYPAPSLWQNTSAEGQPISGISQPPVQGLALERIIETAEATGQKIDDAKAKEIFDIAFNYQQWWYEERDPEGNGLVVSVHPWETGRDNAPEWDAPLSNIRKTQKYKDFAFDPSVRKDLKMADGSVAPSIEESVNGTMRPTHDDYKMFTYLAVDMRENGYSIKEKDGSYRKDIPFMVQDVTINSFLQASNESLIRLADEYGSPEQKQKLQQWSTKTSASMQKLWNPNTGTFQSRDTNTGCLSQTSCASFLPLMTEGATHEQACGMANTILDWKEHGDVQYAVPSSAPSDYGFDMSRYWRGPVWPIVNYMDTYAFMKAGERLDDPDIFQVGEIIQQDTLTLMAKDTKFHEYYNPKTGDALGCADFGFTSVAWLELREMDKEFSPHLRNHHQQNNDLPAAGIA